MPFTSQQIAIAEWVETGEGNATGVARAGAGKTTTALAAIRKMRGSVAVSSYNAEITAEIAGKVAAASLPADVKTAHGFGFRAVRTAFPKVRLEKTGKMAAIIEALETPKHLRSFAAAAASLAKQRAIGVTCPLNDPAAWLYLVDHYGIDASITDELVAAAEDVRPRDEIIKDGLRYACRALKRSIEISDEVIDYDDMVYVPLIKRLWTKRYDWLVIDEAQDTNPARRLLFRAMLKHNGRILFIGDDRQAIYGFTGADNDALDIIIREFNCKVFPLTVTFRCPKAVVRTAQRYVPDIEAAPGADEGIVRTMHERDFPTLTLTPGVDAVICRNTKPLVDLFYSLVKRGVPAYVEGKDEGKALARLAFRWKRIDALDALVARLIEHRDDEVAAYIAKGKTSAAEALADRVDTLIAVIEGMAPDSTMADLRDRLESMFIDSKGEKIPAVALMTAHRSKGREFPRVFIWGANILMPSKRVEREWERQQEENLIYVAITRAIHELVWVDIEPKTRKAAHPAAAFLPVTFAEGHAIAA